MQRPLPAVLSAAGFGLLVWLGVSVALLPPGSAMAVLRAPQMWTLILAIVLLSAAAVCALAGSIPPWTASTLLRAPTRWHRWRTMLAGASLALAASTALLLVPGTGGATRALGLGFVGMLLALVSLGSLAAGAMIELPPDSAAARAPLAVPARLLTALLTGLALMFALQSGLLAAGQGGSRMLLILLVLGLLSATLHAMDSRSGTGARTARHPRGTVLLPALLLAGVPALALALAASDLGDATVWLWVVAGASFGGALIARRAPPAVADATDVQAG